MLENYLKEAAQMADDNDNAQGLIRLQFTGLKTVFGYVNEVEGGYVAISQVTGAKHNGTVWDTKGRDYPMIVNISSIVTATYADLKEVSTYYYR